MEPLEDKNPEVTALMQQFLSTVLDGSLKPDIFAPNLVTKISQDRVNEFAAVLKPLGRQTDIELYERKNGRYVYRLNYGDKHVILDLSLAGNNRIGDVDCYLE
jgi:hypothetical protein